MFTQNVFYTRLLIRPTHANIDTFLEPFSNRFSFMDSIDIKTMECVNTFSSFVDNLVVSPEESQLLEKATSGQHFNQNWKKARSVLITASVM